MSGITINPMQQTIEQLKDLFKQREEIDSQIIELIGSEPVKAKEVNTKNDNKATGPWNKKYDKCQDCGTTKRKHRSKGLCSRCYNKSHHLAKKAEAKLSKSTEKKYHCENCDHEFHSDAHYLEVKCPDCRSRSLLTLK